MTTEAPAVTTNAPAAAPAPAATEKPADATAAQPETPKPEPEKSFTQKELDEIVERRLAKERRKRTEIENRLRVTEELVTRSKSQPEPQRGNGEAKEPKRDEYGSYEEFLEARAEWRADRKVEERFKKEREEQQNRTAAEKQQERAAAFRKRTEELAKDMPDFREVLAEATADQGAPVSRLLAEPINECENPAAVLYHLAKNPTEAERIASLPEAKQAREIWALDAQLKSTPKQPSKAPAPINPVGGKIVKGDEMPEPLLPGGQVNPAWSDWKRRQAARK